MSGTLKDLTEVEGMELYERYSVDTEGYIWSYKQRMPKRLKTSWAGKKDHYRIVSLKDINGKVRSFYVHRLVALAFLPNPENSWGLIHIDGNVHNNSLDNLKWMGKRVYSDSGELDTDTLKLSKELSDYIKLVHRACITKGVPVPNDYEFFQGMINESLEEYINRYGLKKTMHQLTNLY